MCIEYFENKILFPNEKIKAIRELLNIKQSDLANGKINRSLISYIENGKIKLKEKTAKILAENINEIAKQKGLDFKIEENFLLEDASSQAKRYFNKLIKELSTIKDLKIFKEKFMEIEKQILDWDLNYEKGVLYETAGNFYFKNKIYNLSKIHYLKSLEYNYKLNDYNKIIELLIKKSKCCFKLNEFDNAINLNNYALLLLDIYEIKNDVFRQNLLFNNALIFKNTGRYKECIKIISKLKQKFNDIEINKKLDLEILLANCLLNTNKYDKALELYNKIMKLAKQINNYKHISIIYNNIGAIYDKKLDYDKALEYYLLSLDIIEKYNIRDSTIPYISVADIYIKLNDKKSAELNLLKALNIETDINIKIKIIDKLIKLYISNNNNFYIEKLVKELDSINVNENKVIVKKVANIYFKLSNYYIDKDIDISKKYLNIGIKLLDKN